MFFGEYQYRLDQKGRVPVPPKFRREFREGVVLTPGIEKCITVYPVSEWRKIAGALATTRPVTQSKLRRLNRAIFAGAFSLSLDGQGRITLPSPLRQYAEIEDATIVIGTNNCLELWNEQQWETEKSLAQEQVGQIIESLETRL